MEPITLIVTALAAGASGGAIEALKDDVKGSAEAAYRKLRDLVVSRFGGNARAEAILAKYEDDPGIYEAPVVKKLTETGAVNDEVLMSAAEALMELVDRNGASSGKYNVKIEHSQGVHVGDGGIQINKF